MDPRLPDTPPTLLSELRNPQRGPDWQASWERFLEIYYAPLRAMCANSYRLHTGGASPPNQVIEDAVASVVADFWTKAQHQFDPARGKLRGLFKAMCNARVVDHLRKERRLVSLEDWQTLMESEADPAAGSLLADENQAYRTALLHSMIEDVRSRISPRQFAIFEMVKLKGVSPDRAAAELGVKRGVVDNTIYRVMKSLRDIASRNEYRLEWES